MSVNVDMCVRVRVSVVGGSAGRRVGGPGSRGRSAGAAPKVRTPHNDVGNNSASSFCIATLYLFLVWEISLQIFE